VTGPSQPGVGLRRNFAATFGGNLAFAASQWAALSLIAKLGSAEMLGQYAFAVAVASPLALFSHLNLRAVVATDLEQRHPFGDYVSVRLSASALAVALTTTAAVVLYSGTMAVAIVLAAVSLAFDHVSDLYYGSLQRRELMDRIALSMTVRGVLSAAALGIVLHATHSLLSAMAAQAGGRLLVLLLYDRPAALAGESRGTSGRAGRMQIVYTALPLGVVMMLGTLTGNLPRYAVEGSLGVVPLGAFAAVASFLTAGSTIVNALGQAATPRLARCFSEGDLRGFRRLTWRLSALAFVLGIAGVVVAMVVGRTVLRLFYGPAYTAHASLLVGVMAAAVLNYAAGMLGYVLTSARAFRVQVPLLAAVSAVCGGASFLLVRPFGLSGAVLALACGWAMQLSGELWILRGVLRDREVRA